MWWMFKSTQHQQCLKWGPTVQIFDSCKSMVGTNCLFKYEFHNLDTNCKGENWVHKLDAQL